MSTAREEILQRIRLATHVPAPPVVRDYRYGLGAGDVDLFAARVADYRATVHRVAGDDDAAEAITRILRERRVETVVIPAGFPEQWKPETGHVTEPVDVSTLDEVSAALTACTVAIAETGTIVMQHGPGTGARALSLVPDYHLVVVRREQVVTIVPDALDRLDPRRPQTWVSGPSATSDIELDRVEGVHGPRTLDLLLLDTR